MGIDMSVCVRDLRERKIERERYTLVSACVLVSH